MENQKPQEQPQNTLDIMPEAVAGVYSNLALITHSPSEFVVDFASILPGMQRPTVRNRIIMAPEHAKSLLFALQENIVNYEKTFGPITMPQPKEQAQSEGGRTIAPFGDGTTKGEA